MKRWVTNDVFIKAVPDTKKLYRRPRHRDCIDPMYLYYREKVSFTPSIPKNWHVHANSITDLWYYVLFGASPLYRSVWTYLMEAPLAHISSFVIDFAGHASS